MSPPKLNDARVIQTNHSAFARLATPQPVFIQQDIYSKGTRERSPGDGLAITLDHHHKFIDVASASTNSSRRAYVRLLVRRLFRKLALALANYSQLVNQVSF